MGIFCLLKTKDKDGNKHDTRFLREIDFLKHLNHYELKIFSRLMHQREYKPGEVIFREGYPHAVLYIVKRGKVDIVLEQEDGDPIKLAELNPQSFFGEIGLFIETSRTATAIASEDTILLAVSKVDFQDMIDKYPRIGVKIVYELGKGLSNNVVETNKKLREITDEQE